MKKELIRSVPITRTIDGWLQFCAVRSGKDIACEKKGIDPGYSGYNYTVIFEEQYGMK